MSAQRRHLIEESEGEAGDNGIYAQWAGGTVDDTKPMPKFEKSVFDLKYQKDKQRDTTSKWKSKDKKGYDSVDKRQDDTKEKRNRSKKRAASKEIEEPVEEKTNKH